MATEYTGDVVPLKEYTGEVIPIDQQPERKPAGMAQRLLGGFMKAGPTGVMAELARPGVEAIGNVLSSGAGAAVGGLSGLANLATGGSLNEAANSVQSTQNAMTFQPRTPEGQRIVSELNSAIQKPTEGWGMIGGGLQGAMTPGSTFMGGALGDQGDLGQMLGKVGFQAATTLATKPWQLPSPKALPAATKYEGLAKEFNKEGYVMPPSTIRKTFLSDKLETLAKPDQVEKQASMENQVVTNNLVKKELGVPEKLPLTTETFEKLRAEAGKSYAAVKDVKTPMKTDTQFRTEISKLGGANSQAAKEFPGLMANPEIKSMIGELYNQKPFSTTGAIELVKQLRFNAKNNLKTLGSPEKHALGLAQREAADAMDSLVERNLAKEGKGTLVPEYRKARQQIAKTYDIESITNNATENVSALGLARLLKKDAGRLSGNLKTVARFAESFPKAARNVESIGGVQDYSNLDFAGAALTAMHGNYGYTAWIAGRPAARNLLLSKPYQNSFINPTTSQIPAAGQAIAPAIQVGGSLQDQNQ